MQSSEGPGHLRKEDNRYYLRSHIPGWVRPPLNTINVSSFEDGPSQPYLRREMGINKLYHLYSLRAEDSWFDFVLF